MFFSDSNINVGLKGSQSSTSGELQERFCLGDCNWFSNRSPLSNLNDLGADHLALFFLLGPPIVESQSSASVEVSLSQTKSKLCLQQQCLLLRKWFIPGARGYSPKPSPHLAAQSERSKPETSVDSRTDPRYASIPSDQVFENYPRPNPSRSNRCSSRRIPESIDSGTNGCRQWVNRGRGGKSKNCRRDENLEKRKFDPK